MRTHEPQVTAEGASQAMESRSDPARRTATDMPSGELREDDEFTAQNDGAAAEVQVFRIKENVLTKPAETREEAAANAEARP